MTRGTIYLITNQTRKTIIGKKPKVLQSVEFNGDMFGSPNDNAILQKSGNYPDVIKFLKKVKTSTDFKKAIIKFNATHHNYKDKKLVYNFMGGIFNLREKKSFYFDLTDDYFRYYFSDYLYFKNGSEHSIYFKAEPNKTIGNNPVETYLELQPGKIATFYFGRFIEKI